MADPQTPSHSPPHSKDDDAAADAPKTDGATPRKHREERLDEGVEETFPASDPVSAGHIT